MGEAEGSTTTLRMRQCLNCKDWGPTPRAVCPICGGQGWYIQGDPVYITEKPITLEMVTEIKPSEIDYLKQRIAALEARVLELARLLNETTEIVERLGDAVKTLKVERRP